MTESGESIRAVEQLFVRGRLTRAQFVEALLAAGITASGLELLAGTGLDSVAAAPEPPAQYLVLIVLDAFRPDYLRMQRMPALEELQAVGVTYDRAWAGQLQAITPASHATLSTGAFPRRTGILGFEWADPVTHQKVLDGWRKQVMSGSLERDLIASGTHSIPQLIKAASPQAKVVALSSEKVYAASAMGGHAADYILYHVHGGAHGHRLLPRALPGHLPPRSFFAHPNLTKFYPLQAFSDWDWLSTMLALTAAEEIHPKALMVNFPAGDVYGHAYAGPENPAVMKRVIAGADRNLARIIQSYRDTGKYDRTLFVVLGDHGMIPNHRAVGDSVIPKIVRQAGGEYLFHWGGTGACIWLRNGHAKAVARAMLKVPGVSSAYYLLKHDGKYHYALAPGARIDSGLDAANQFLLSTFAGSRGPDVVAPFRENTIGARLKNAFGDHSGLSWGSQHVPLVLAGPGVRKGSTSHFPARLVDVAPTILRLLAVPAKGMDGAVLADAMTSPVTSDVTAQASLAPVLTAFQDSLITQSTENIQEDKKLGLHSPPPRPVKP